MKLFGNKRHAAHLSKPRLSGLQRGLILLAVCLVLLSGTVIALYQSFVKPPETIRQPEPDVIPTVDTLEEKPEPEVFTPPTVIEVQTKVDEETGDEITVEVEVPAYHKEGFYNILIVGTDDEGYRTDTIMIGRLNTKDHTVALLSIPRDTLIDGDYKVPKINSVYGVDGRGEKGIQSLKTKLAQLLGFEVDGYAIVNLDAFIQLVDLVGGVEVDVPMDMDYEDQSQDLYIHLKKGVQHLDGQQAMGLVRYRKGYASQDIQRTQTQQLFLKALAKKCLSVVNLGKIGEMAQIFLDNVTTDLTLGNIAYFGQELLKCDFDTMYTHTLQGEAVWVKDASCYAIYLNKTLEVVNQYFNPYETEITEEHVTIRTPEEARAEQAIWEEQNKKPEEVPEELPEENPGLILPDEEENPWGDLWDDSLWEDAWEEDDFWFEEDPESDPDSELPSEGDPTDDPADSEDPHIT